VYQRALLTELSLRGIRATAEATNEHVAQCLNYLRASGLNLCLLVNFQKPKVEWRRIVLAFQIPAATEVPAVAG
jgi:hypothetical protein